jgi:hypothetical protein
MKEMRLIDPGLQLRRSSFPLSSGPVWYQRASSQLPACSFGPSSGCKRKYRRGRSGTLGRCYCKGYSVLITLIKVHVITKGSRAVCTNPTKRDNRKKTEGYNNIFVKHVPSDRALRSVCHTKVAKPCIVWAWGSHRGPSNVFWKTRKRIPNITDSNSG